MEGSGESTVCRYASAALPAELSRGQPLDGLLGVLGMRSGDKVLLAFDT